VAAPMTGRAEEALWLAAAMTNIQENAALRATIAKIVEKDECDNCKGKCRSNEIETCEKCA